MVGRGSKQQVTNKVQRTSEKNKKALLACNKQNLEKSPQHVVLEALDKDNRSRKPFLSDPDWWATNGPHMSGRDN